MTLIYATPTDLATWTGATAPANAVNLLRSASMLIADVTSSAFYPVNVSTGLPTDVPTLTALRDATCAQAALWAALKIDPAAGPAGVASSASSKKVGTAALTYNTTAAQTQARMDAAKTPCEESLLILRLAGLLATSVWSYG
jgi:hypothetical protein